MSCLVPFDAGAVLLPVTLSYPDRADWAARIHPQVHIPESGDRAQRIQVMTQQVADAFADGIADHPQDWHMLQRVWLDDLDASRLPDGAAPVTAR